MSDKPLLPSQEDKAAVAEIFADLRDRKFLKYLFDEEPENCGAYGYIECPFDAAVQAEIAEAWADIIARHAASSRDQGRREGREEAAKVVAEKVVPEDGYEPLNAWYSGRYSAFAESVEIIRSLSNPRPSGEGEDLERQARELLAAEFATERMNLMTNEVPGGFINRRDALAISALIKALSQGVRAS